MTTALPVDLTSAKETKGTAAAPTLESQLAEVDAGLGVMPTPNSTILALPCAPSPRRADTTRRPPSPRRRAARVRESVVDAALPAKGASASVVYSARRRSTPADSLYLSRVPGRTVMGMRITEATLTSYYRYVHGAGLLIERLERRKRDCARRLPPSRPQPLLMSALSHS